MPNNKIAAKNYQILSYEDIFLTKQTLSMLTLLISDLAENEYTEYHIKYKVVDRLVRLCTKLIDNDFDVLVQPVVQCLYSKFYLTLFDTVNLRQPTFSPKQSFFIRDCFDFIEQHGYKRRTEIAEKLCKPMLQNTISIFAKHLSIIKEANRFSKRCDKEKGARMQAISDHIKLLNYFAITPSTRKEFLSFQTIIDEILSILNKQSLIDSVHKNYQLYHVDVGVVAWSLILLYNLTFDKELFNFLKGNTNVQQICERLHTAKDDAIHFTSQNLATLLKQKDIDKIEDPYRLTNAYLYYLKNAVHQPNQSFHGIPLDRTLNSFESKKIFFVKTLL